MLRQKKKFVINILNKLTGNNLAQRVLEKLFHLICLLLGIGSGDIPSKSGEERIISYLLESNSSLSEPIIIFDVGANTGQFLEMCIKKLDDKKYNIFSFEPVSKTYNELERKFNNYNNIIMEKLGFDNIAHKSEIFYDFPGSLRASKYHRDLRHLNVFFNMSEIVDFETLDRYCLYKGISSIDLLKIDVEGNELNVLRGAEGLLKKGAIKKISFEFGRAQIDSGNFFKNYYYYLLGYGMKHLFRILPNGYLKPIKQYNEINEIYFTTNYLAEMK